MGIGGGCHTIPKKRSDQKVVVMEGPDGCGKTNIGHGLSLALQIPYFRMASQHENWRKGKFKEALQFDQTYILEFLKQTGYDCVIDRAWPSEWVYSKVYGRETDDDLLERIDREHSEIGTTIVVPLRRDYTKNRKDEVVADYMLSALHEKYLQFVEWTRCSVVALYVDDYDDDLKKELGVIVPELLFDDSEFRVKTVFSRDSRKFAFGRGKLIDTGELKIK